MKLSQRLEMVASFVYEGSNIADIGTDHGYIPIALINRGIAKSAIAMDVGKGPLKRAESHIQAHHLEDKIQTRLSDGTAELAEGEADTVIIAGMGGELVIHILENGRCLWNDVKQWVLSPQSELGSVRQYLDKNGFCIEREAMVEEDGKFYTVMSVIRGEMGPMRPLDYLYGKYLIKEKNPVLQLFLLKEQKQMEAILEKLEQQGSQSIRERTLELCEQLHWIKEAQDEMR